jgi:hypothetical protein
MLPLASGSKYVVCVSCCACVGLCFERTMGRKGEAGAPAGSVRTVDPESCERK